MERIRALGPAPIDTGLRSLADDYAHVHGVPPDRRSPEPVAKQVSRGPRLDHGAAIHLPRVPPGNVTRLRRGQQGRRCPPCCPAALPARAGSPYRLRRRRRIDRAGRIGAFVDSARHQSAALSPLEQVVDQARRACDRRVAAEEGGGRPAQGVGDPGWHGNMVRADQVSAFFTACLRSGYRPRFSSGGPPLTWGLTAACRTCGRAGCWVSAGNWRTNPGRTNQRGTNEQGCRDSLHTGKAGFGPGA